MSCQREFSGDLTRLLIGRVFRSVFESRLRRVCVRARSMSSVAIGSGDKQVFESVSECEFTQNWRFSSE